MKWLVLVSIWPIPSWQKLSLFPTLSPLWKLYEFPYQFDSHMHLSSFSNWANFFIGRKCIERISWLGKRHQFWIFGADGMGILTHFWENRTQSEEHTIEDSNGLFSCQPIQTHHLKQKWDFTSKNIIIWKQLPKLQH